MATAKKAAPAAKKTVAAPAPAPAPAADEGVTMDVGTSISFLGYDESVPAEEQYLTQGETYVIAGFTDPSGTEGEEDYDAGGDPYVMIANPSYNAKARESDANPKQIAIPVYEGEYEVLAEEAAAEEAAPAPAPAAKTAKKAAPAAAPAAKTAAKAPAPAAKTAGKKAAPAPAAPAEPEEPAEDPDAMPDLEGEDEEVLALVSGDRDLIEVAQELEATAATSEYRLGGVLFHIKKDKTYLNVEGGEQYAEKGGFGTFLRDYFNVEYRKAMYLIDIYIAFTQAAIENPAEAVARMGWAKASKIARPMQLEGANPTDLVSLAENNTLADLSTAIKEQVEVGGTRTPGTKVTRTTLKFRLLDQEGATVTQVLEAVQSAQSLKDIGEALVYVINDWAANNAGTSAASAAPRQAAVGKPAAKKAAPAAKKAVAKA